MTPQTVIDFLVPFLIAALSGMGVGSGGLLVVWLTALRGVKQLAAQGINLFFFLFASGAALLVHVRNRKILWGLVGLMALGGILGTVAGTTLAHRLDPALIRKLFGGMLTLTGVSSLFRASKDRSGAPRRKVSEKDGKKLSKPLYK